MKIFKMPHYPQEFEFKYQSKSASGIDLPAAINTTIVLDPLQRKLIPTGIKISLTKSSEGQIRPRSGLALKHGVSVLNAPGTIDADYRGEVKVLLINLGSEAFDITPGMRIAQLVICPTFRPDFTFVDTLDETERGEGGFGSTGA